MAEKENMKTSRIANVARSIRDYWFLVTILVSASASRFYMKVYHDKYREIEEGRERVRFHNSNGEALSGHGYYKEARMEFQMALDLQLIDKEAMNGRYLSDLFIQFDNVEWNHTVALVTENQLENSGISKNEEIHKKFHHIIEKYLGDVNSVYNPKSAEVHYQQALSAKQDYVDALFRYGWFVDDQIWDVPNGERPPLRFFRRACNCLNYSGPRLASCFPPFRPSLTAAGSFFFGQIRRLLALSPSRSMHDASLLTDLDFQNSRLLTTNTDASTMRVATNKLARIPGHGRSFARRNVFLSIEKSPVTRRQMLKRRSQLSNSIAVRSTTPKARAGAVYSPETTDETNTAIAK